jgi:hypothetical protein
MLQSGCVIYGGDQHQARTDWPVHSWQQLRIGPPTVTPARQLSPRT